MTTADAETQFWLVFRIFPVVPFLPLLVSVMPWMVVLPAGGLLFSLWARETRWVMHRSRTTLIWFWITYLGSFAVLAAHAVFGSSAKFTINAFAVPALLLSALCMALLCVGNWARLSEVYAEEVVRQHAVERVDSQRRIPRL